MNDKTPQTPGAKTPALEMQSGKINGWLKSSVAAQLTGAASLGATRVVLTWDVSTRVVALSAVDPAGDVLKTYFSVDAGKIERATFFHNNYFLRVGGVKYDISLRDVRADSGVTNDAAVLFDNLTGGILAAHVDSRSDISYLQQMLQLVNPKTTYTSKISSKSYARTMVIATIVVIVIVAIILGGFYMSGRR